MKKPVCFLFLTMTVLGCKTKTENENAKLDFLTEPIPNEIPLDFKKEIIPENKIIHKGTFSPDLKEFYYTLSDKDFENFDVYRIAKNNGVWTQPEEAFFTSEYNEHGMSFSPDGTTIYFSSTRPVDIDGVPSTWHIWKSDKIDGKWNTPVYVDIPNLRDKLVSHPTITNSGTLYFHSSKLDYSGMHIYKSIQTNNTFTTAQKVTIPTDADKGLCTPFVSPNEEYLIFAAIGKQLDLLISFKDGNGNWTKAKKLNDKINHAGQGNPYVTPDNNYLFYTVGDEEKNWKVKWVDIRSEIKKSNANTGY